MRFAASNRCFAGNDSSRSPAVIVVRDRTSRFSHKRHATPTPIARLGRCPLSTHPLVHLGMECTVLAPDSLDRGSISHTSYFGWAG